jgi:hypothetical protein
MGGGGNRGGGGGGGGNNDNSQQQAQQQAQQAQQAMLAAQQAAAAAEKQRVDNQNYQTAITSAQNQALQGTQVAQQQIAGLNAAQQATDAQAMQPIAPAIGGSASYSIGNAKQAALGAVGAGGGTTGIAPTSTINQVADTTNTGAARSAMAAQQRPVNVTGSGVNQFTLPATSGITFGGQ